MTHSDNGSVRQIQPPLVYVVDDEPMLLELARLVLAPYGYELHVFRNPVEALECFQAAQPKPELVVTDYAMSEMNGIRLMQAFRKTCPNQKVLLVSGTVGREICQEVNPGPDGFLAKPFDINKLVNLVNKLTR
jgi:two-component system, cell cycle sensor histidine kinase and response regulator CckA